MDGILQGEIWKDARIIIVDDQPANVRLLERHLQNAGYSNFVSTTDPHKVQMLCDEVAPDLLLLDLMMPGMDGFGVMDQLDELLIEPHCVPVLMLTADISPQTKCRALSAGAKDFLTKPFDGIEVLLRIRNLLEMRRFYLNLQNQNNVLEQRVLERTTDLQRSQFEVLERLAVAAEYRDDDTGEHTQRVGPHGGDDGTRTCVTRTPNRHHSSRRSPARHRKNRHFGQHLAETRQAHRRRI
jgi:putative two-component system response regulator